MKKEIKKFKINVAFPLIIFGTLMLILNSCNNIIDAFSGASKTMEQDGNSLFHQTDETTLKVGELFIGGEVEEPGKVELDDYYKREVFIKESTYDESTGINFIGAYRYRGYSLFDLLNPFNQKKKNMEAFKPAIDLYIIIENEAGDNVVFSWSEIFHTNIPHQIIIATESAPIVPHRKEVDYIVGDTWKVVAANDLFSYRTLENPSKITVLSFDKKDYPIQKGLSPMYSPDIKVVFEDGRNFTINEITDTTTYTRYYASFYGMGMGFHEVPYFQGPLLNDLLKDSVNFFDPEWIRNGLVCFSGQDGYRSIYSFSELFNRTDQVSHMLSVAFDKMDGGYYRIFHPAEFYADRSVKSLKEMYFFKE
ncbi:MAG: hypothetical protein PHT69_13645 [Bacteroidales bacterium]|nr:hypothetical protein [Bacteroidales bacterium]